MASGRTVGALAEGARVNWGDLLDEAWGDDNTSCSTVQDGLQCSIPTDRENLGENSGTEGNQGSTGSRATVASFKHSREPLLLPCSVEHESRAAKEAVVFASGKLFPIMSDRSSCGGCVSRGKESKKGRHFHKTRLCPVRGDDRTRRRKQRTNKGTQQRKNIEENKHRKLQQLCLDLGQKNFGHVTCKVCGMVYTFGQAEDEREHMKFHRKYLTGLSFLGWKSERVVGEFCDGRIIVIYPSDPKHHWKKIHELRSLVDSELGYASGVRPWNSTTKVYLYISTGKKVVGCVFAEKISQAYPVLSHPSTYTQSDSTDSSYCTTPSLPLPTETSSVETTDDDGGAGGGSQLDTLSAWYCSPHPQPASVGVNRVWVCQQFRRMGVASRILDTVRFTFLPGDIIEKDQLAFSDPTPSGKALAARYCNTDNFLVYH